MKILISGGAGYIGSVLTQRLLQWGHRVTVLDDLRMGGHGLLGVYGDPNFRLCKADIRDEVEVRYALKDQKVVIHLAALVGEPACQKDPVETREINLTATSSLLKLAKSAGVEQFIFASTCSNYGKVPGVKLTEDVTLMPLSLYSETKVDAEGCVWAANEPRSGFATTIFRFATVYGVSPRMRFDLLINEFVRDAFVDGWLLIYGRESWRPFVHVRDIPYMFRLALEGPSAVAGQVYNVGGYNLSKMQIIACLKQRISPLVVEYKDGKADPRDYKVDFGKAEQLGFKTKFRPMDGIEEIVCALRDGLFDDPHSSLWRNV